MLLEQASHMIYVELNGIEIGHHFVKFCALIGPQNIDRIIRKLAADDDDRKIGVSNKASLGEVRSGQFAIHQEMSTNKTINACKQSIKFYTALCWMNKQMGKYPRINAI